MHNQAALDQFKQVSTTNQVDEADPHKLIAMLFEGLLDRLVQASGCAEREDYAQMGGLLSKCLGIIDHLRASLNHDSEGDLSLQLQNLYTHMEFKLLEANKDRHAANILEVIELVKVIKEGWDGIDASAGTES